MKLLLLRNLICNTYIKLHFTLITVLYYFVVVVIVVVVVVVVVVVHHNMVAQVVHWNLCNFFNLPLLAEATKILWDFSLFTNIRVQSSRPEIVVFLKNFHYIMFVEISCPADVNVFDNEGERSQSISHWQEKLQSAIINQLTSSLLFLGIPALFLVVSNTI